MRTGVVAIQTVAAPAKTNGATNGAGANWAPEPPMPVDPWSPAAQSMGSVGGSEAGPVPAGARSSQEAPEPHPAEHVHWPADAVADASISDELRAVAEGLKLQQSMLADLLTGLTRQQAMMAELLDARHAELRLAIVAESLPDSVRDAVTSSFSANEERMAETALKLAESIGMDAAITDALRRVSEWSEERFDELATRQEKLVAKAMRAGAKQASPAKKPAAKKPAAKKPAAKRPAAKKPTVRKVAARKSTAKKSPQKR
jgi:hypothetical protein